ncbi:MAG: hypothetical protein RL033_6140 [Pseudomonadota bacterium]|jgi:DNA invertase Pin-like site-specific DNA recombinase
MSTKLSSEHLSRQAVVYVRQSTMGQVLENRESQRRQYGLADRAKQLGFRNVQVVDDDLGRSGSGLAARPGFDRLVAMVCSGTVGAIFCIEASRLARNGRDWHYLIDFCALVGTVIVDHDGVYDPRLANDRLLLGMKGTMNEFEVTLFRQRSLEAKRAKAQRGELQFPLPVGFQWTPDGSIEIDPNRRVQQAIEGVFERFQLLGSIRQVLLAMRREKLRLPTRAEAESRPGIEWKLPVYNTVHRLITNPLYGGAYAYGKTEARTKIRGDRARKTTGHRRAISAWTVLIRDHHRGYISWAQYERNQRIVASNAHMKQQTMAKAARGGRALLGGLLRCRRCGRRLHVTYGGRKQPGIRYECRGAMINHGEGTRCVSFGALRPDEAISRALLDAVSPGAIDAAVEMAHQMASEVGAVHKALGLELEQARYEAKLATRRYEAVDPANRLVALELEKRWNEALARVQEVEARLAEDNLVRTRAVPVPRESLMELADSLPMVWNSSQTDMRLKQRIARLLIAEIIADVDVARSEIVLLVHWQGGRHSEIRAPKNRTGQTSRRASVEVEELVRRMAERWSNIEIAATLNRIGLRTGTGLSWNDVRVKTLRVRMGLPHDSSPTHRMETTVTLAEAVDQLGVSNRTIMTWIQDGLIPATQVMPHAPYEIPRAALSTPEVRAAIDRAHAHGKAARKWARDRRTLKLPGV